MFVQNFLEVFLSAAHVYLMKRAFCLLGLLLASSLSLKAVEGPSLDYLKKGLNKVTYAEVIMESAPPTSKETLPDGSIIAYWNDDTVYVDSNSGGVSKRFKMCIFNSKGVLTRYKWKRGILGGDSKEDSD